ncbi:hypothetical protein [Aquipseudomonas alcaligenes]|uniref:Uncharacterized protein n=1 Tax=Aquipseudomonas alcaligenes TaxID=43263 RepID=A0A1N6X8A1_AQUAC|nr:hypothetical protein [Pseudomonas alcaligenes]SIQ98533.1 hypothetical protein SAMN05878282_11217 [Pseudomonas alcaligenes]
MHATPQVVAALNHVRTLFPDVTQVFYGRDGRWQFLDDDLRAPVIGDALVDVSLLEDAVDSLSSLPAAFHVDSLEQSAAESNLLVALRKAEDFISGFEDDDLQEGVDELLVELRAAINDPEKPAQFLVSVSVRGGMVIDVTANVPGLAYVVSDFDADDMLTNEGLECARLQAARYPAAEVSFGSDPFDRLARVQALQASIAQGISSLRGLIDEPEVIPYSRGVYLEVTPASQDERINVCHHDMGWTTVNYTSEGLLVDVLSGSESTLEPVHSVQLHRDDLVTEDC